MLRCHGVRGGESADAPMFLRLLLGRLLRCLSYLRGGGGESYTAQVSPIALGTGRLRCGLESTGLKKQPTTFAPIHSADIWISLIRVTDEGVSSFTGASADDLEERATHCVCSKRLSE